MQDTITIVIPWFGPDTAGGAETQARQLASAIHVQGRAGRGLGHRWSRLVCAARAGALPRGRRHGRRRAGAALPDHAAAARGLHPAAGRAARPAGRAAQLPRPRAAPAGLAGVERRAARGRCRRGRGPALPVYALPLPRPASGARCWPASAPPAALPARRALRPLWHLPPDVPPGPARAVEQPGRARPGAAPLRPAARARGGGRRGHRPDAAGRWRGRSASGAACTARC